MNSHVENQGFLMKRMMFAALVLLAATGSAGATMITYTETTIGSGTLGTNTFRDALITMIATADTTAVTGGSGFFSVNNIVTTVTVDSLGLATFTTPVLTFDNQSATAVGFATSAGSILDTVASQAATYGLTTPIGPFTGGNFIRPDLTFATTLGGLNITSVGNVTFTAAAVPEPSTFALLSLMGSVSGLVAWRRRRAA
jgi:hypothetical protein